MNEIEIVGARCEIRADNGFPNAYLPIRTSGSIPLMPYYNSVETRHITVGFHDDGNGEFNTDCVDIYDEVPVDVWNQINIRKYDGSFYIYEHEQKSTEACVFYPGFITINRTQVKRLIPAQGIGGNSRIDWGCYGSYRIDEIDGSTLKCSSYHSAGQWSVRAVTTEIEPQRIKAHGERYVVYPAHVKTEIQITTGGYGAYNNGLPLKRNYFHLYAEPKVGVVLQPVLYNEPIRDWTTIFTAEI